MFAYMGNERVLLPEWEGDEALEIQEEEDFRTECENDERNMTFVGGDL